MSSEPVVEKKRKEIPFVSQPTLRRRAAVRASAKIGEVLADSSGPTARRPTLKTSSRKMEGGGHEKNKSCNQRRVKEITEMKRTKKKENICDVGMTKFHGYQRMVDVHDRGDQYTEARILELDPEKQLLYVHYMGWNARFDAWVDLNKVKAHGSRCDVVKRHKMSWNGNTSLFATKDDIATHRQSAKCRSKKSRKKWAAQSPISRHTPQDTMKRVRQKNYSQEVVVDEKEDQNLVTRLGRRSPKIAKVTKKLPTKSPRGVKKVVPSPGRRTPRRVRVAVGTIDEDSERKNGSETADLVLDVEIDSLHDESDVEGANDNRTQKHANERKTTNCCSAENENLDGAKRKREAQDAGDAVNCQVAQRSVHRKKHKQDIEPEAITQFSPQSQYRGLGNATREKLAAIFRLRMQQKQQIEQMKLSKTSFQQSLQDPAVETLTVDQSTSAIKSDINAMTVANAELAAAEEYQRQLQQYYYQQQVSLVSSRNTDSEDPSKFPLRGGIMDPRIIQERLTALEERRRQQAHVQAYYRQLMLTRERNVRALAANQAFMATSAAVWEQQVKETQSEDGTSPVSSSKDGASDSKSTSENAGDGSETDNSSRDDNHENTNERQSSLPEVNSLSDANKIALSDTLEKADASSPARSDSNRSDPADTPTQGVLYEFVL
ncbi:RNA binding activity-knot of a chromodomain [Plasmopara halstedii]|uniref:RNA binding activity-knot of a chromodomain n=1 Tax=Plasmopara halstedii TaxID=4781 RepID=A0A0N7L7I4_PLAHL|nr:RNA binding activity-knot of a chromodomain [Plasmopara halstedii]CEG47163.1 RNA binding activity-knot of a chromodomain [Plasmopara halstedii]|eukprot:XP_024583532.1 RNA binding activity-knot of a chromodomain [Plasmopara halstedii]